MDQGLTTLMANNRHVEQKGLRMVGKVAVAVAVMMALTVLLLSIPVPNNAAAAINGNRPFVHLGVRGRSSSRVAIDRHHSLCVAAAAAAGGSNEGRGGRGGAKLSPVVLVPGTGGTQIEARLTDQYQAGSFWCWSFSSAYFRLWLDVFSVLPPFTSCFAERLQLVYNEKTGKFENYPGVETRVPYWGTTEGIEVLDPNWRDIAVYMGPLVASLKEEGYVVGETLFGAPYDFRYAPGPYAADVAIKFEKDLKDLIEQAYSQNSNTSVVLVAHSLGGLWTLYVINQQPLSWRKQFIKSLVSIGTPFAGAVEEMRTFASGNSEGYSLVDPLVLRTGQRSSESNLWLLPVPKVFGTEPLVFTKERKYTAYQMEDFLTDIGYPEGVAAYNSRIPYLIYNVTAPGVPVSFLYGHGVKTPERLFYDNSFDEQPAIMEGDGDGTVNHDSLVAVIAEWRALDGQPIREVPLADCSHFSIVMESDALKAIVREVLHDWNTTVL